MSVDLALERELLDAGALRVIGIDEVGRGALAGPVSVAAVAVEMRTPDPPPGLDDSKKLSAKRRAALLERITTWAVAYSVIHVPAARIDDVGIMTALGEGAHAALVSLNDGVGEVRKPVNGDDAVLLDGKHDFLTPVCADHRVRMVVGGDGTCASIAAASIVAKQARDALMRDLHKDFAVYEWNRNVGYGTAAHRRAIDMHGASRYHRHSWRLTSTPGG